MKKIFHTTVTNPFRELKVKLTVTTSVASQRGARRGSVCSRRNPRCKEAPLPCPKVRAAGPSRSLASSQAALSLAAPAASDSMAFRRIRDHSQMGFADSFSQDMDFWRQRIDKETTRIHTPSAFTRQSLSDLPRNPFRDSGGMLLGKGVSPRYGDTDLGVLAPDLAAYRAAVNRSPSPWTLPGTPIGLVTMRANAMSPTPSLSPESRAAKGAMALQPLSAGPGAGSRPLSSYESNLLIEAPNQRVNASLRRVMPRSRLDARMYAASPG